MLCDSWRAVVRGNRSGGVDDDIAWESDDDNGGSAVPADLYLYDDSSPPTRGQQGLLNLSPRRSL